MLYLDPKKRKLRQSPDWVAIFEQRAQQSQNEMLTRFYQHGVVTPETPLSDVPFVALDLETTGLDSKKDGIVSIGLVPFTLSRIRCADAKHWIVDPKKPLAEASVVIHGITHSDVHGAPDLTRVLAELLDSLAGKVVVVHYRKIEREFLDTALKARLGEGITFPVIDTMEMEAEKHRNKPRSFIDWIKRKPPESIRLADSRARYGLPFYQGHQALTDAVATAELLQAQIAHDFEPDTPIKDMWL